MRESAQSRWPHLLIQRRLRELAAASVAVGAGASLEDVLQKTVDAVARLVRARYAAVGVLDRSGAHLERLVTVGIDDRAGRSSGASTRARTCIPSEGRGVIRLRRIGVWAVVALLVFMLLATLVVDGS